MDGSTVFAKSHQCAPPLNTCFLGPPRVQIPNGILTGSAVFAKLTAECPYTSQWAAPSHPPKLLLPMGDIDPDVTNASLGPPESSTPTACISVCSAVFAGLTSVTGRQTNHATRSVTIGHIYVCSTVTQPSNVKHINLQQ